MKKQSIITIEVSKVNYPEFVSAFCGIILDTQDKMQILSEELANDCYTIKITMNDPITAYRLGKRFANNVILKSQNL